VSGLADEEERGPEGRGPEEAARQSEAPSIEDLAEALRQIEVGQFLLSTVSTLASLAYGKIEQGELAQAKVAIDATGALLPVLKEQVQEDLLRDFERALANLRLAYADAAAKSPGD
jgi:hypothetical protein